MLLSAANPAQLPSFGAFANLSQLGSIPAWVSPGAVTVVLLALFVLVAVEVDVVDVSLVGVEAVSDDPSSPPPPR